MLYEKINPGQKKCNNCREAEEEAERSKHRKYCEQCGKKFYAMPVNSVICEGCRRKRSLAKRRYYSTIEYRHMRSDLLERMGNKCARCLRHIDVDGDYHLHHVVPIYCGGKDEPANLTIVCRKCHKIIHERIRQKKCQGVNFNTLADALA